MQGLLPIATVYLTKSVVDSLVGAMGHGDTFEPYEPALWSIGLLIGVMLLGEILDAIQAWVKSAQDEYLQDHIKSLIHQRSATVDLAFYESSEFYDRLDRARQESSSRTIGLLENIGGLLQNGITLVAMTTVLIPYGPLLPVLLIISTLPAFYVVLRADRRYHRWWQHTTQRRRWTQYFDAMLTHNEAAAEVRSFGLAEYFQTRYQHLRRNLRDELLHQVCDQHLARISANILALVIGGLALLWMAARTVQGNLTLGDLAFFYQAFSRGQSLMRVLLTNVGQVYSNSLFLGDLFTFLDLEQTVVSPTKPQPFPTPVRYGIVFDNVSFRYPHSERLSLDRLTLEIPAGQIAAIVGVNGAGKTTLFKLLCRFYDPNSGRITIDGVDLRELALVELRRQTTVLFQFPVPYHATAAECIALGDIASEPSRAQIERAAHLAGIDNTIAHVPQGYDTLLGKWFADGVGLSGGEQQRVATARAFLRRAPIVILDEPTSFMDSWAEADWFDRFRSVVDGQIGLVITHRFTIAMRADIIHVMEDGRIVESGTHAALLAGGGRYAQSWEAQMRASGQTIEEYSS